MDFNAFILLTEVDKAELGLLELLGSIIVVDPLSLPLYEVR